MPNLITVPSFIFKQGDVGIDERSEFLIQVQYYTEGLICLESENGSVNILKENLDKLVKEIKRHLPEAESSLKNRK